MDRVIFYGRLHMGRSQVLGDTVFEVGGKVESVQTFTAEDGSEFHGNFVRSTRSQVLGCLDHNFLQS